MISVEVKDKILSDLDELCRMISGFINWLDSEIGGDWE